MACPAQELTGHSWVFLGPEPCMLCKTGRATRGRTISGRTGPSSKGPVPLMDRNKSTRAFCCIDHVFCMGAEKLMFRRILRIWLMLWSSISFVRATGCVSGVGWSVEAGYVGARQSWLILRSANTCWRETATLLELPTQTVRRGARSCIIFLPTIFCVQLPGPSTLWRPRSFSPATSPSFWRSRGLWIPITTPSTLNPVVSYLPSAVLSLTLLAQPPV